jgi:hypothetical protein
MQLLVRQFRRSKVLWDYVFVWFFEHVGLSCFSSRALSTNSGFDQVARTRAETLPLPEYPALVCGHHHTHTTQDGQIVDELVNRGRFRVWV